MIPTQARPATKPEWPPKPAHRWRRAGPPSHRAGGAGGRGELPRPASTPRHGSVRLAGCLRCSRRDVARTAPRHRRKLGTGIVEAATVQSVLVEPLGFAASFFIRGVPGGGRWGGATGVAVPERRTGSGTGGEDEVGSVDGSPGGAVDQNRLGFDCGFAVDEHHAALARVQARVAPRGECDNHGPQGTAEFGQHVLVADRLGLVLAPFEQADVDQALESAGQQARGNAQVVLELVEAGVAVERVMKDEQRPPFTDQAEGGRQRALPILESDPLSHVAPYLRLTATFEAANFWFRSD